VPEGPAALEGMRGPVGDTTGGRRGSGGVDVAHGADVPPAAELVLTIPADAARLSGLRRAVVDWAGGLGADEATVGDLQLAVGEAAANGVEHAYRETEPAGRGGTVVEVALCLLAGGRAHDGRVIAVRVRDRGRWRRPPADPGRRGRGLAMIRAVAAGVVVRPGRSGTEVAFEVPFVGVG